ASMSGTRCRTRHPPANSPSRSSPRTRSADRPPPASMLHTLRTAVPAVWFGLIVARSFLETPLKFLAPGITLEIALGAGRPDLTAANIARAVLVTAMTLPGVVRPRIGRGAWRVVGGLWPVLLLHTVRTRPPLNARTDMLPAGGGPGSSPLHI